MWQYIKRCDERSILKRGQLAGGICGATATNSCKYTTTAIELTLTPSADHTDPNRYRSTAPDPNLNEFMGAAPQTGRLSFSLCSDEIFCE